MEFSNIHHIHFVGIGGIGVSAIARKMLSEGKQVSGSDASESALIETLSDLGADISVGHHTDNIDETIDLIIYSVAVPYNNPELVQARELGISQLTYAEALGVLSEQHMTVAVSGTHGKTTTTAMLARIAEIVDALDPTVIVGSILSDAQTNYVSGSGEYLIVEACEYKRSFIHLFPDILVITNVDRDHLDYFDDLADIQDAFREVARAVPPSGIIVCDPNDTKVKPIIDNLEAKIVDYSQIDIDITLPIPGEHNIHNAQAAVAAAEKMGAKRQKATEALSGFSGTWRRAEKKGETADGTLVYDDYAHHPTEIRASLAGFRQMFPQMRIIAVFQPHLYSRTKLLLEEFAGSFSDADEVVVLPIYAARETPDEGVSSEDLKVALVKKGADVTYCDSFGAAEGYIRSTADEETLVITVGAGDVYKIAEHIVSDQ